MPERLHKILLLNPPSIFRLLLSAAKPFVDQRTLDKLIPVTGPMNAVLKTLKEEHDFPESALSWLEKTLNQKLPNKSPPLPHDSRGLMLPSLVPMFQFLDPPMPIKDSHSTRPLVRANSLLTGSLDNNDNIFIAKI